MTRTIALFVMLLLPSAPLAQSKPQQPPRRPAAAPATAQWDRVTGPNDSAANEVSLARTADGVLHVAWLRVAGGEAEIVHATVNADGTFRGNPRAAVTGWKTLSVPAIVREGDNLRLLFGGVRGTSSSNDPYNAGSLYSATAGGDGDQWTLVAGSLSDSTTAYVGPVSATNAAGTVVTAWTASDTLSAQIGLGAGKPRDKLQQSCCPYQPGLAVDGQNGEVAVAWYSNDSAHLGANVQVVTPSVKDSIRVPGSFLTFAGAPRSGSIDQRVPISGRIAAPGLYVAYCAGYPTFKTVNLWRIGDAQPRVLASLTTGRTASVTSAPEGRLWVMWANAGRFVAVRSNRAVSRFSAPIAVGAPARVEAIYRVTGEGSPGPLDLFAHVSTTGTGAATWHTRVYPVLEVTASPRAVTAAQGGAVTVTVTDVGDPIVGARVTIAGTTLTTAADGKITYQVAKGTKPGVISVVAALDQYTPGKASISVK